MHVLETSQLFTSWWLNQPLWKICSSNWIISPGRGENIKCVKRPPSSIPRAYTKFGRQQQQSKLWCVSFCSSKECTGIIAKDRKNTEAERCFNSQGHPLFIEYRQIHLESFERTCYKYFEDVLRHLLKPGCIVKSWNHFPNSVREQL